MNFGLDELKIKNDTLEEQERVWTIFNKIKDLGNSGVSLSEHEKNFFCLCVQLSHVDVGSIDDYSWCNHYKFRSLYLTYFRDLLGGTTYRKHNGKDYYIVSVETAFKELQYLDNISREWEETILKTNHTSTLLQQISAEARKDLKTLANLPEFANDPYIKGTFLYRNRKKAILLQGKFIYCIALEVLESLSASDRNISFNGETIEYNEYSIIHILNRHYAEIVKPYNTQKSFHNENFAPRLLSTQLKKLLEEIDGANLFSGKSIDKIAFKYNDDNYIVWTHLRIKSVIGAGNVPYRRLETFYPVNEPKELVTLENDYDLIPIRQNLFAYVKK